MSNEQDAARDADDKPELTALQVEMISTLTACARMVQRGEITSLAICGLDENMNAFVKIKVDGALQVPFLASIDVMHFRFLMALHAGQNRVTPATSIPPGLVGVGKPH